MAEERQEEELLALQAIYPEVEDLREARARWPRDELNQLQPQPGGRPPTGRKWSWRPLEIRMRVKPDFEQCDRQVDLRVRCGRGYPAERPEQITLAQPVGLSRSAIARLEAELATLSGDCAHKGEEQLFLLIARIKEFLLECDEQQPPTKSFYDQMLSNRQRQQQEQAKQQQLLKDQAMEKEAEINKVRLSRKESLKPL